MSLTFTRATGSPRSGKTEAVTVGQYQPEALIEFCL